MKKTTIVLLLFALIAGLFISCSQEMTVDADVHNKIKDKDTFCINGKYFSTLQAAVDYFKNSKAMKAPGDNDNVIYLTRNASGPGADIVDIQGLVIDFAGFTYSFTNVTAIQGETRGKFGLSITNGSEVTLKGLEQIDLFDSTADLTMVYIEGSDTSLTIEDAPKMKVEPTQYVFWAANGATLTVGSNSTTAPTTISGKIAATGGTTAESKPVVTFNNNTSVKATEFKADAAVVIVNTSSESTVDSFVASNNAVVVVSGSGDVKIESADYSDSASYEIQNISEDAKIIVKLEGGSEKSINSGEGIEVNGGTVTPEEADYVARIGSSLYDSLAGAVNAATAGQTVTMLKDVTYPAAPYQASNAPVTISKSLTLDGNGFTLTSTSTATSASRLIRVYKAYGTDTTEQALSNHIEVNIVNLTVVATQNNGYAIVYDENVSGTISNCTVTSGSNGIAVRGYSSYGSGDRAENSVLTVSNCTVTGDGSNKESSKANIYGAALDVEHGATLIVDGGVYDSIYNAGQAVSVTTMSSAGTIIINGGTFNKPIWLNKKDNNTYGKMWDGSAYVASNPPIVVKVNGGTFVASDSVAYEGAGIDSYTTMTITGGTFSADPSTYVDEGYVAVQSGSTWTVVPVFASGKGTEEDPFIIANAEQLGLFRDSVNQGRTYKDSFIKLNSDIALTGTWTPIGNGYRNGSDIVGKVFKGTFDGSNLTISGLSHEGYVPVPASQTDSNEYTYGLFGVVNGATIKNVKLTNVNINGGELTENAGGIVGFAVGGATIYNCKVEGTVTGNNGVGGIVGRAYGTVTIDSCKNVASVTGSKNVGGIAGFVSPLADGIIRINECKNEGAVTRNESTQGGNAAGIACYGCGGPSVGDGSVIIKDNENSGVIKATGCSPAHYAALTSYGPLYTHGTVDIQSEPQ